MSFEGDSLIRKKFSYEEALAMLPVVQEQTETAVRQLEELLDSGAREDAAECQTVISGWAESIMALGIEVKGLWLIDFDCGSGYYCWRYPEPSLQFFHGYEEGFAGRVELN